MQLLTDFDTIKSKEKAREYHLTKAEARTKRREKSHRGDGQAVDKENGE